MGVVGEHVLVCLQYSKCPGKEIQVRDSNLEKFPRNLVQEALGFLVISLW